MSYLIKNKNFIFIAFLFVSFVAIVFLVILPTVKNISAINNQIMSERLELENKLAMGLNIKKTNEALEKIKNDVSELDTVLIGSGQELELIQIIENFASANNLIIRIQSNFQKEQLTENVDQTNLTIETEGEFAGTVGFIESLESMPYYYNVDNVILTANQELSGIKSRLTGKIYFKK